MFHLTLGDQELISNSKSLGRFLLPLDLGLPLLLPGTNTEVGHGALRDGPGLSRSFRLGGLLGRVIEHLTLASRCTLKINIE